METNEQLLQGYSDREKGAYLGAIASIATADREASAEEIEFLQALAQGAGLSEEHEQSVIRAAQDPSNIRLQDCLDTLKNSELRFSLITDIIAFAKIDGQYTTEEQQKIQQMSSYLNIDSNQYNALNQFVDQAESSQSQGQDLTNPDFLQSTGLGDTFRKAGINSNTLMKGMLGILAPIVLSRMLSGRRGGGMMGGMGGLLGGLLGGGMMGGMGGMMGGGMRRGGLGGLGSIFDMLSGGRGYRGAGGLLGGLFGGGRRGGFGF